MEKNIHGKDGMKKDFIPKKIHTIWAGHYLSWLQKRNPDPQPPPSLQSVKDLPSKAPAPLADEPDLSSPGIAERKTVEDAQLLIDLRHFVNVKCVPVIFWEYDLVNQYVYLSSQGKQQTGYGAGELQNFWSPWERQLYPHDKERVIGIMRQCLAGERDDFELEYRMRQNKNTSCSWIYSRGSLLYDAKGRPCRLAGMNLDITPNKNMQAVNERRQKIDESYPQQIALQTVAALAHEINQPLMAVASYIEIALHLVEETDIPDSGNLLTVLNKSSEQLMRAGQAILQLMNMLQKDEPISESVVLDSVIHEACEIIRTESSLADIKLELCLAPNIPPVKANVLQIEKVVVNLLRNGVDAMREASVQAGTITLTTGVYAKDPAMAEVTVRDSGKGLDPEILRMIFQPFFSTKSKGLGMGLAISRALIEAHNGKLWAESNPGSGSSFHFTLPFVL
jgi:PAS domain S-box-containing protein